ncbi:uncharacterized protein LOC132651491 isoform X2 [Meriones unguiculatus]|uniref:uncharacterized protein LOC132651491 isoform X2 n=1 Tax=Meriones unguiculatus TaxID=10047 RepID=UPI00293EA033|nr:uncharacterized protein LOC132651491 isoform X2 [Meriones unguiculatus]
MVESSLSCEVSSRQKQQGPRWEISVPYREVWTIRRLPANAMAGRVTILESQEENPFQHALPSRCWFKLLEPDPGQFSLGRVKCGTVLGRSPSLSYPGNNKSRGRAEIEGCWVVESSAFSQRDGAECDWTWWGIDVTFLPPLCSSTSARAHGHRWWSPSPCFHYSHEVLLSVFIICACQHFRSPAWPRKAPAMSSKDGKAIERSAKRRRTDAVVPAENPAVDTSELGSCSSGSNVQEARKPVEMSMQDIRDDITQILMVERKQFEKDINASFTSLYENLQSIFKTQQESRKARHSVYSQMFWPLYQQWQEEVERAKDQEENLAKAKDLCEHHKTFIGGHQSEVEKEISKAQDRVIMKTQEQDVSVVETYLQSLVLDSSEETI